MEFSLRNTGIVHSPKEWNKKEDRTYFSENLLLEGFSFYENIFFKEGFQRGILPPPLIFLSSINKNLSTNEHLFDELERMKYRWAKQHNVNYDNAKVGFLHKWQNYEEIIKQLKEFQN